VLRADGGAVEAERAAAFEDAIDDGVGEVVVVEDGAPAARVLIGGEDHGAAGDVALVHDVVEHVGGVVADREVANLVDDEVVRADVGGEGLAELAVAAGDGQLVDEVGAGREERVEAVLQGPVGDRDGEVSFPAAGLALEDDGASPGGEVGREEGPDRGEAQRRLVGADGLCPEDVPDSDSLASDRRPAAVLSSIQSRLLGEHRWKVACSPVVRRSRSTSVCGT
jgi:hypothetical protein